MSRRQKPTVPAGALWINRVSDAELAAATVDAAALLAGIDRELAIELELEILRTGLCLGSDLPGKRCFVVAYAAERTDPITTVFRLSLEGMSGNWSICVEAFVKAPKGWVEPRSLRVGIDIGRLLAASILRISPEPSSAEPVQ